MELIRITSSQDSRLVGVPALYEQSFPVVARIPSDRLLALIDELPQMAFHVVCQEGTFCGMAVAWDLGTFRYLEYFALVPACRCQGLGSAVMASLLEASPLPVVGEVEPAQTDIQRRRIGFYRRNGFTVYTNPAILNAYHPDNPLWLIASQPLAAADVETCQLRVIDRVYRLLCK